MPCICYGAISGKEEFDSYLNSNDGKITMLALEAIANRIKNVDISEECMSIDFRQMFVKAFLHMLVGCDEQGRPKVS